jgi:hypothetical protein
MPNELVTKSFAAQCLAFPDRVETMLAEIGTVAGAKDLLDKAATMQHYAERLKAGIEIERPIALGVLKIKAKLGELMPAKPPQESGAMKGKGSKPALPPFSKPVIATYRKLAAKERQRESGGDRKTEGKKIGSGKNSGTDSGESRDQAASLVGVSPPS